MTFEGNQTRGFVRRSWISKDVVKWFQFAALHLHLSQKTFPGQSIKNLEFEIRDIVHVLTWVNSG